MKNNLEILTLDKKNVTDFARERNLLLAKAKSEWVFFLDSDEKISEDLGKEILTAIRDENIQGYFVTRRDFIFGKELKHGEFSRYGWFGNAKLVRLGRKSAGKWVRAVHEEWMIKGKLGELKNPLMHYPHPRVGNFIAGINSFSTLHAKALKEEGKRSGLVKIIVWPLGKFIYNFVFRLGFLDGTVGFIVALIMSSHSFLAWSKLWEMKRGQRV